MSKFITKDPQGSELFKTVESYEDCTLCPLHTTRCSTALWRGFLPCDILFINTAPGIIEDITGTPFRGPAGRTLDQIIKLTEDELALDEQDPYFSYAMTGLVCCIPRDKHELRDPDTAEIEACSPRLNEFINIANPSLIVRLGKLPQKHIKTPITTLDLPDPQTIYDLDKSQFGFSVHGCVSRLFNAITRIRK